MALVRRNNLGSDERGAAIMEFSVVAGTMVVMLFGLIEFAHLFSQWNAAVKAVQAGARIAATSAPLWEELADFNGGEQNTGNVSGIPGQGISYTYDVTCDEASGCTGTENIKGNTGMTYDAAAMDVLVFGRDPNTKTCQDGPGQYFGMCDIYKRIGTANVKVTYQDSGAGYATRPGGLVPTVKVEIVGLNFQFIFLDDIMGLFSQNDLNQVPIPGLLTTMIAEDMRAGAPTF